MTAAIVLVGGRGSRLAGVRKPLLEVGGRTLLARTLAALGGYRPIVAVGPTLDTGAAVTWVREDPPFGGPVAAIAAGMQVLSPSVGDVLVLAGDLVHPESVITRLESPAPGHDAVVLRADGHPQWLAGRYRSAALRSALQQLGPAVAGASCRAALGGLAVYWVDDDDGISADIDTPADLERFGRLDEGN